MKEHDVDTTTERHAKSAPEWKRVGSDSWRMTLPDGGFAWVAPNVPRSAGAYHWQVFMCGMRGMFGRAVSFREAKEAVEQCIWPERGTEGRTMKMNDELYAALKKAVCAVIAKNPGLCDTYIANGMSEQRFRWDMMHASGFDSRQLYAAGLHDDHIDTALRRIVNEPRDVAILTASSTTEHLVQLAREHAPQSAATVAEVMRRQEMPWVVMICYEGDTKATVFTKEAEAREFFAAAKLQWSEAFLLRAVEAPRDWKGTP